MPYLKRKIDLFLEEWKNDTEHLPLIVKGARQIGKTESIRAFAAKNYQNIIEINFVEEPKYKMITSDGYKVDDIIKNISLLDPSKKFIANKTLIFFDELQDFPEISTTLKFFKIDGRFDVICSGSLLGIHYKKIESNSVGYKTDYEMTSLDFEEFLWAKGYDNSFTNNILNHMITLTPFSTLELTLLNNMFLDFTILGGMPAVVRKYIETNNFSGSLITQRQLLLDYEEDIRKYAEGIDQTRIINVFNHIPTQLAKENKKFQISKVAHNARFRDYRGCIEWLNDTSIINLCRCLNYPELPLKGNYDENKYKIYLFDTGLLIAMLDDEAQDDLRSNKNLGVYKGAIYENMVGEALSKCGYKLYYYKKDDSTLEQDFFIRSKSELIPIEVKSTNGNTKSMNELITNEKYPNIKYGIKLIHGNIGYNNNIYTFPYFTAFLLKKYLNIKSK